MHSCEIRRRARSDSMMTDLGSPLPLVMPTVAKTAQKEMAKVTRRAKGKGKPRAKASPNGTGLSSGTAKVRATTSKRKSADHARSHELAQPRHPRRLTKLHKGRTVKRDKAALVLSLHAQRRVRQGNAHHVTLIMTASHSGRAVSATRLRPVRNNTSDLMALPAPLLWPRRLKMLINQRARRPRSRKRRKPRQNETNLWFSCKALGPLPHGERRAREKGKATMISEVYAFTGSKLGRAHMGRPVGIAMVQFLLPRSK